MSKRIKGRIPPSGRYSPLRYPGGKGKLARFVSSLIKSNDISDGLYVEPYAGGAAVAWELLLTGIVRRVAINDVSRPVYAFWHSVLNETDELAALIADTPVTVEDRDRLKAVLAAQDNASDLELGFAMFFLNRTHRSGILNGGVIGGRDQTGKWKIDARYNKADLIQRIERIAAARRRIELTNLDAIDFLETYSPKWPAKTLVYLDPPYYEKGSQLYYDYYSNEDHEAVSQAVRSLTNAHWIVSYDDVSPIQAMYNGLQALQYTIGYSARNVLRGREAMFFSDRLQVPDVEGSMVELHRSSRGGALIAPPPTKAELAARNSVSPS
ncbi:DNA adenine methylase [Erythrobacter sp. AP23]|uniref:DNA adenine methylase n=1 Tax=Erythrobacter sp. AP23 TaxID=499656 RepID=UPI0009FAF507|nr:DNA adenine methylase [Erythrobacter sp. AP23]